MIKLILVLLLVGILVQLLLHRLTYRERDEICSRSFMRILFLFTISFLGLALFNQIYSIPHRLLGETMLVPGSLITRSVIFPSSYFFRRFLEPSSLFFLLCAGIYGHTFIKKSSRYFLAAGLGIWVCALGYEAHMLMSQSQTSLPWLPVPAGSVLWIASLVFINLSFISELFTATPFRLVHRKKLLSLLIIAPGFLILSGCIYGSYHLMTHSPEIKNLMTHYYVWFPENWKAGYAGQENNTKHPRPFPEEYNSDDQSVIIQHINQMKEAGITHAILDWWPRKPLLKNRAIMVAETFESHGEIKFAAHLETLEIFEGGSRDIIHMGEQETSILSAFMEHLVKRMNTFDNYQRIDGKMVIYLYASRHLTGDIYASFNQIREYIRDTLGEELYLIGDEIFYNVPDSKTGLLLPEFIPSWERLRAFDAITLYNPYNPHATYENNDSGIIKLVDETRALLYRYRGIAEAGGVPLIPAVIPGYNDRVLRPDLDASIIPRMTSGNIFLLDMLYTAITKALGNSMSTTLVITSWNEWNEGTQIEPGVLNLQTSPDTSQLASIRSWRHPPTSKQVP
jgi:hypothetical protein